MKMNKLIKKSFGNIVWTRSKSSLKKRNNTYNFAEIYEKIATKTIGYWMLGGVVVNASLMYYDNSDSHGRYGGCPHADKNIKLPWCMFSGAIVGFFAGRAWPITVPLITYYAIKNISY